MPLTPEQQYSWDGWADLMKDNGVTIPAVIQVRLDDAEATWVSRQIEDATLDELATAIVCLDEKIEHLTGIRSALAAIQKLARRHLCSGSTLVFEGLFRASALGAETTDRS